MSAVHTHTDSPMQVSMKDPHMPASIRMDFIKKVYGILIVMLLVSFGIAAPFVYSTASTMTFYTRDCPWILTLCLVLLAVQQVMNVAIGCEACTGGSTFIRAYLNMFKTVPFNYIFLLTYAACFGVLIGFTCAQYKAASVGMVFLMTAGIMVGLTIFAITTSHDFSGFGMYIFAMLIGLILLGVVSMLFPVPILHTAMAAIGAVIFSFVIIYDTQLIFGTVAASASRSNIQKIEFTVDMYAFAAYQLYLDFVNMFLYLLQLFGERK